MSKIKIRPKWLRLTEEINALDYLQQAHNFLLHTEKNPIFWKWVIISLYGALYGFAICALKGTNYHMVTFETKKGLRKLITFDVLGVVRFLALSGGLYVNLNKNQRKKIKSLIFQSRHFLKKSKLYQEATLASKV